MKRVFWKKLLCVFLIFGGIGVFASVFTVVPSTALFNPVLGLCGFLMTSIGCCYLNDKE